MKLQTYQCNIMIDQLTFDRCIRKQKRESRGGSLRKHDDLLTGASDLDVQSRQ
jgi:hypothetical protein